MIYALAVLLYFVIGGFHAWEVLKGHFNNKPPVLVVWASVIIWPVGLLLAIVTILKEFMIHLYAVLLHAFSTKLFWLIVIILTIIFSCKHAKKVNAAVITGDKALAGFSVLFEEKARQGITWYDQEDLELLAQVLEHENYSNGEYSMYLTGAVVINRRNSPRWPNTIKEVIYQTNPVQYSTIGEFWSRPVHRDCYRIASWLLIFGCPDVPPNVVYQATFKQGSGVYKHEGDYFCYE